MRGYKVQGSNVKMSMLAAYSNAFLCDYFTLRFNILTR